MFARLAFLFVTIPLVELFLLIQTGRWLGLVPTVALVIATGILGAALARQQGLATWTRFQRESAAGRPPGTTLLEGVMILAAGAVLLTPGLLTDLAGFALLIPPVRRAAAARVGRWLAGRVRVSAPGFGTSAKAPAPGEVIDVEATVVREPRADRPELRAPSKD